MIGFIALRKGIIKIDNPREGTETMCLFQIAVFPTKIKIDNPREGTETLILLSSFRKM